MRYGLIAAAQAPFVSSKSTSVCFTSVQFYPISYPEQCLCAGWDGIGSGEIEFFLCCDWFNVYQSCMPTKNRNP